jgi:hypothetical protein
MFNFYKNKKNSGEIATLVAIGSLIVLGISTLLTSKILDYRSTSNTRAEKNCQSIEENQSCTNEGEWCGKCTGNRGPCNADAGVGLPFKCVADGSGNLVWKNQNQYGECMQKCVVEGGEGTQAPSGEPGVPPGGGGEGTGQGSPGCFHLGVESSVNSSGSGAEFNFTAKFYSDGGDGDIRLEKNGTHVAGWNGWNKGVNDPFVYSPQYTGSPITVAKGSSSSVTYTGFVANSAACPNNSSSVTCNLSVSSSGQASSSCGGSAGPGQPSESPNVTVTPEPPETTTPATTIEPDKTITPEPPETTTPATTIEPDKTITPEETKMPQPETCKEKTWTVFNEFKDKIIIITNTDPYITRTVGNAIMHPGNYVNYDYSNLCVSGKENVGIYLNYTVTTLQKVKVSGPNIPYIQLPCACESGGSTMKIHD